MIKRSLRLVAAAAFLGGMGGAHAMTDIAEWQDATVRALVAKQRYPRMALDASAEGTVKVRLAVAPSGDVMGYEIVESSGYAVLDASVLDLLARVSPLPALPVQEQGVSVVVPLTYKLDRAVMAADVAVADPAQSLQEWRRAAARAFAKVQEYPVALYNQGIEGTARIQVAVDALGNIVSQELIQSSGNAVLDEESMSMLRRVGLLPELPEGTDSLRFTLPVTYRIR
ncbi:energy transducer TonB [Pseudokordiimonas caeni]|uniref:energy transducer TonB n=1 Tax=Pseudokordiimonas caeni TaxID=2997908 RepID=UPI002811CF75|nr:energy transducer TonB [Pseudokordiimonas caeni]